MSPALANPPETAQAPLDSLYEVIDGRRVEKPPMAADSVWIASILVRELGTFARTHELGRVVCEMLFHLQANRPHRRPDVAFVSYERWPRDRKLPRVDPWDVVPDLAIEVVSPTNSAAEVLARVGEYFHAGVQRVWVVYPSESFVYVYASPTEVQILQRGDELDGAPLLPGFRLPLTDLFEDQGA